MRHILVGPDVAATPEVYAPAKKARGEFTPNYFWTTPDVTERESGGADNEGLPQRVYQHLPDAKCIVILRDPVERAVSAYFHHIRARRIRVSERLGDLGDTYGLRSMGYYDVHLARWQVLFPKERWLVLFYEEDIVNNKELTLRRVFEFLDVNPAFLPRGLNRGINRRRSPLHMRLNFYAPRLADALDSRLPTAVTHARPFQIQVSVQERAELAAEYAPHNERLAEQLGRQLPW